MRETSPATLAAPAVGSIPRQYGGDSGRAQHLTGVSAVRSTGRMPCTNQVDVGSASTSQRNRTR